MLLSLLKKMRCKRLMKVTDPYRRGISQLSGGG